MQCKKAVYVAQSDEQKLDLEFEQGTVFRVVKQMVGENKDIVGAGCVKGADGKLVTGEAETKDRWKIYFDKLLNEEFEWNKDGLTAVDKVCEPAEIISCSKMKSAITKTKSGKAAGPSGVVAEMLRAS